MMHVLDKLRATRVGLLRNAAIYALANIGNSGIPFLLLPLLTRVLSPQDYGLVSIFTTLVTAFGALAGLSVHGAVNRRLFDAGTDHARYIGTALMLLAGSTLCVLVGAWILSGWLTGWSGLATPWLLLAVLAAAAQFVVNVRLVVWQTRGQAARYGAFQVLQTALNLGISLLLVFAIGLGWQGRIAGIAAALLVFAALGLLTLQRAGAIEWRFDRGYARDALRFGLPLLPHVIGSLLIAASDRVMVASLMSLHDAGIYSASMQIGLVIGVVADAAAKAVNPWLYARMHITDEAVQRKIVRATYGFFAAIAVIALLFGGLAPWLLTLVGGSFRSSPEVVAYVALGSAFGGMYLMVVNYIFHANRNELIAAASVAVGIGNLVLTRILVERHGVTGAAQAYALAQLVLFLLIWSMAAHCRPMPWLTAWRRSPAPPVEQVPPSSITESP